MIVLLVVYAKKVDWERSGRSSATTIALHCSVRSGCGRQLSDLRLLRPARPFLLRHKLAKRQVMLVSFICYAFNLHSVPGSAALVCAIVCTPDWVTGQHYYADFFAQYYHQLARYILLAGVIFTAGVVELPDHCMSIKLRCVFSALAY